MATNASADATALSPSTTAQAYAPFIENFEERKALIAELTPAIPCRYLRAMFWVAELKQLQGLQLILTDAPI
ncbi:hypothetical protein KEM56_004060, partial [Ascosphaera pollenicola]